ncbi:hypothetical protein [Bordetella genomosp. 5]|uniref:DUF2569 domain-containing protein n=1 Tax=Bordetella genomosp. 5 TaxID=1395608 RepID=A0A261T8H4_9BORD|nr:hypothetical protein [Bordetella genomosp. 5]OZI45909.1 hypothetical protein CAL25_22095 [Bordetella genomosp. 5]
MTAAPTTLPPDDVDDPGALNTPIVILGLQLLCLRPIMDIAYGARLFGMLGDNEPASLLSNVLLTLLAALCLVNIAGGVLLFVARRPLTLRLTYLAVWAGGPVGGVLLLTTLLALDDLATSEVLQTSTPGALMASMVAATLWTVYLALAGHVKVRYGVAPR